MHYSLRHPGLHTAACHSTATGNPNALGLSHLRDRRKEGGFSSPWNAESRCGAISVSCWTAIHLLEKGCGMPVPPTVSREISRRDVLEAPWVGKLLPSHTASLPFHCYCGN